MTGIGGVAGNAGGGVILSDGSWRWLFAAAVPISLLLVGASVALLVSIVQGPEAGWGSGLVSTGFACSAVLFVGWTLVE